MQDSEREALRTRILAEIARLAKADGSPLGRRQFSRATGISEYKIAQLWQYWTDATTAAGLVPNEWRVPGFSDDQMLQGLADLTRSINRVPARNQLIWAAKNRPGFPSHKTLFNRFGSHDNMIEALTEWTAARSEYGDVSAIIAGTTRVVTARPPAGFTTSPTPAPVTLSDSYTPPIISLLAALSEADAAIVDACRSNGRNEDAEFERRVAIAFEIIGLAVDRLGQGYGRVADGLARCGPHGWAVLYDAKVRREGYRLQTEDRKFREYIETHVPPLRRQGLQRCYFAVISSRFSKTDLQRAQELTRLTEVKSCVFLEAAALAAIAERRIRLRDEFSLDDVERLFSRTRIVTTGDVG